MLAVLWLFCVCSVSVSVLCLFCVLILFCVARPELICLWLRVQDCKALQSLNLWYNQIGDEGAKALCALKAGLSLHLAWAVVCRCLVLCACMRDAEANQNHKRSDRTHQQAKHDKEAHAALILEAVVTEGAEGEDGKDGEIQRGVIADRQFELRGRCRD